MSHFWKMQPALEPLRDPLPAGPLAFGRPHPPPGQGYTLGQLLPGSLSNPHPRPRPHYLSPSKNSGTSRTKTACTFPTSSCHRHVGAKHTPFSLSAAFLSHSCPSTFLVRGLLRMPPSNCCRQSHHSARCQEGVAKSPLDKIKPQTSEYVDNTI